jgi:hypothetical protein
MASELPKPYTNGTGLVFPTTKPGIHGPQTCKHVRSDSRWDGNDLNQLKTAPASAFEVVQTDAIYR